MSKCQNIGEALNVSCVRKPMKKKASKKKAMPMMKGKAMKGKGKKAAMASKIAKSLSK